MNTDIRYIFLDLGGTFRVIDEDPAYLSAARAKIAELCGVETGNPNQWFSDVIDKRQIPGVGAEIYVRGSGGGPVDPVACL